MVRNRFRSSPVAPFGPTSAKFPLAVAKAGRLGPCISLCFGCILPRDVRTFHFLPTNVCSVSNHQKLFTFSRAESNRD